MDTRVVLPVGPSWRRVVFVIAGAMAVYALAGVACRSQPPAEPADASHEGHETARVYFVEPKDGATVPANQPVKFVFGSDNYTIAAVPEGEVTDARADMGHFHLGVDKECLPPGEEIVRGTPDWVHFGTGSDNIEMSLTPGVHTFAVQVGDDLHRAVEGLCETITVTVQ